MTIEDITMGRLRSQQLGKSVFTRPEEVVAWLGAVQAQDYAGAQWSVGLRLPGSTAVDIDTAIADRKIVLTWALRGTLHLVAATDIRWLLALLAPRIIAKRATRYRQLGLDEKTFAECNQVLVNELKGNQRRTRKDLLASFEDAGISSDGQRGYHLLGRAGLDQVICFGPMEGRQQTFVLLDEWILRSPVLNRDALVAGLARHYFTSHGPATLQDFLWWSGLSSAEARSGIVAAGPDLRQETVGGQIYWRSKTILPTHHTLPTTVLLPAYDEYLLGYRDRTHALDPRDTGKVNLINGLAFPILINGRVMGTWKRASRTKKIVISLNYFDPPKEAEQHAAVAAAERYGTFVGKSVEITRNMVLFGDCYRDQQSSWQLPGAP
jgi:hypothetical protein